MNHLLIVSTLLALALFGACSAPEERPAAEPATLIEKPSVETRRKVRLVEVDSTLELEESGLIEIGEDRVFILEGSGPMQAYYAGVRVNDGPGVWLDLYTDEERAAGSTPVSGWGWSHIATANDGKTIVGVLGWFVESGSASLYIVTSEDGGRTWYLRAEIKKPHHMAIFDSLELAPDVWELTIRLDSCGGCGELVGETILESAPGGDEWRTIAVPTVPDRP